eukprot:CAMPEP_0174258640 /NCGR_PEP_ID=MMETSP0439-20130205/7592_1 /TAXON_ID=0 /ORGANISM="Stereomyxa ramosa, Strain Chinc5" /LENGTH=311 /DNA_ID=CAMNT_0015342215 /DNA_START=27 /DNA_END=962 /DNA_ORIENTATION=+
MRVGLRRASSFARLSRPAPFNPISVSRLTFSAQRGFNSSVFYRAQSKVPLHIEDYSDITATDEQIKEKAVSAPLEHPGKAGEYAAAFFEAATTLDLLEEVGRDLKAFDSMRENEGYQQSFHTFPPESNKMFAAILKDIKANRLTEKFFAMMIFEGYLHVAPKAIEYFLQNLREYKKEINVVLTFAEEPNQQTLDSTKGRIYYHLPEGANPSWIVRVDPSLIRGVVVDAEGHYSEDSSLASELKTVEEVLGSLDSKVQEMTAKLSSNKQEKERAFDVLESMLTDKPTRVADRLASTDNPALNKKIQDVFAQI